MSKDTEILSSNTRLGVVVLELARYEVGDSNYHCQDSVATEFRH